MKKLIFVAVLVLMADSFLAYQVGRSNGVREEMSHHACQGAL